MQSSSAQYLEDIRGAAQTILEITSEKGLADYLADRVLRLAVERCFEIIGEAMRRLDETDRVTAAAITDYQRIIAFRNVLIHGYSVLKHERVWSVVENQLPILLKETQTLLAAGQEE